MLTNYIFSTSILINLYYKFSYYNIMLYVYLHFYYLPNFRKKIHLFLVITAKVSIFVIPILLIVLF